MKLSTVIFLVLAGFGSLGYLCSGWLMLETLSSENSLLASFTFTNLFILWKKVPVEPQNPKNPEDFAREVLNLVEFAPNP